VTWVTATRGAWWQINNMSFLMNAEIEGSSQLRIEHPSLQSLYKVAR
jgi:hypothetical protein